MRVVLIPETHTILPNLKRNHNLLLLPFFWIEWYEDHEYILIDQTFKKISMCSKMFVECIIYSESLERLLLPLLLSLHHSLLRHFVTLRNQKELALRVSTLVSICAKKKKMIVSTLETLGSWSPRPYGETNFITKRNHTNFPYTLLAHRH